MKSRLTLVQATSLRTNDRHIIYLFKCRCGNDAYLPKKVVASGNTRSCGCLKKETAAKNVARVRHLAARAASVANTKHGMRKTRFYKIWQGMKSRCSDVSNKDYGGRGISVCKRWSDFENFKHDMYESYLVHRQQFGDDRRGTTIERIDVNGNYEPNNCTWATMRQQCSNTRRRLKQDARSQFVGN